MKKKKEKLRNKLKKNWINFGNNDNSGVISIPPRPGVELGISKYCYLWNTIIYKNEKADSIWGSTLPKIRVIPKNGLSKSYWALNSVQKTQWAHMSVSPRGGARGI